MRKLPGDRMRMRSAAWIRYANGDDSMRPPRYAKLSFRFTGDTTQTISPNTASHAVLSFLSNYALFVKMGLIKGKYYNTMESHLKPTHSFKDGDLLPPSPVKIPNAVHARMGREVPNPNGYDHHDHYKVCVRRLKEHGLIHVEYGWTRTNKDGTTEYMIPLYSLSPLGEQALAILEAGAFFVLRYRS